MQITSISFFQKYRLWKTFVVWKKNVSTATMNACKASLQQNLFILNPLLRKSLIALRKLSYEVSTFKLYHVDPRRTYTLEEFCEMQVMHDALLVWVCAGASLMPCPTPRPSKRRSSRIACATTPTRCAT